MDYMNKDLGSVSYFEPWKFTKENVLKVLTDQEKASLLISNGKERTIKERCSTVDAVLRASQPNENSVLVSR